MFDGLFKVIELIALALIKVAIPHWPLLVPTHTNSGDLKSPLQTAVIVAVSIGVKPAPFAGSRKAD